MDAGAGPGFAARLSIFYAALFLIYGVQVPYLPVWLDWRGLSPAEIGLATAAPFFARSLLTPLVALYADGAQNHRRVIIVCAALAVVFALLLAASAKPGSVIFVATLLAVAVSSMMPLTETVALDGVLRSGLDYGRMRLWGSLTFVLASFAGGALIGQLGAGAGIWLIAAGTLATLAAALLLPRPGAASGADVGTPPETCAAEVSVQRGISVAEALELVRSPVFLAFLVAAGTTQASHAMFYTFGVLHWREQGLSSLTVGCLWAIGVMAEVALFTYSGAVVRRFGALRVLIAGAVGCVTRWTLQAFDPGLAILAPLQVLHALTYAASHLGAMHFIATAVPRGASGTAQGLYSTVAAGFGMGGATLLAGALFPVIAGKAYLAMSALSAIGLVAALYVARAWHGGMLTRDPAASSPT